MSSVLIPLPDRDFDVTEVAVPWRLLVDAGHDVVFGTETGTTPAADPKLIDGVLLGKLGAEPEPLAFYRQLVEAEAFTKPLGWSDLEVSDYDALLLPGGHAPGMRQYLGSPVLQGKIADFWALDRPVAAICHGVLPLDRRADDLPAEVLGALGVPADGVAAREVLPHVPGVRGGRGARVRGSRATGATGAVPTRDRHR